MIVEPVYDKIVCFGDSLTQQAFHEGFVGKLQEAYQRRLDVISRGFSGYTSRQALALCPTLFPVAQTSSQNGSKVKLATIWFGTNDAIKPGHSQHIPIQEYTSNMRQILQTYFTNVDVVLITPATVVPGKFDGHEDDALHVEYAEALADVARSENEARTSDGNETRVALVDMRSLFVQASQTQDLATMMQEDGLHIAPAGYKVVYNGVKSAINQHFPHLTPEKLPYVFPDWKDLDLSVNLDGQKAQLKPKKA